MKIYFAYGSNLCFRQMASRCPESQYLGRAVLAGHRIQINERGYANIIADAAETVEGLCFQLSQTDEDALDVCEGVALLCYSKSLLHVNLFAAAPSLRGQRVADLVQAAAFDVDADGQPRDFEGSETSVAALVYMSALHVGNGVARNGYKKRIARGVQDARRLGVSPRYLEEKVGPLIQITAKPHWMLKKPRKAHRQKLDQKLDQEADTQWSI
ncbi:hypothetical protein EDC01DRAFT_702291 [Geopyxis carbonaria]|nr:hypothetical protein EDC01DRAFT_702291 [Geopyxis carbonaria]